jgi:exodeoxyribonuclease VII large subunit
MENVLLHYRRDLDVLSRSAGFRFPQRLLQERTQRLDAAASLIGAGRERELRLRRERLAGLVGRLRQHRPDQVLALRRLALEALQRKLETASRASLARKSSRFVELAGVLRVLSPDATLARGYSITSDATGAVIRGAGLVRPGDKIQTRFVDGSVDSKVL